MVTPINGNGAHAPEPELANVSVIGAGYVGLVTSACLASFGHNVTCLDIDSERIESLREGMVPIFEPGLSELVSNGMASGHLHFTTSYREAFETCDLAMVAVNTPSQADGSADTTYVREAMSSVLAVSRPGLLVAIKSTVPVGTCDSLQTMAAPFGVRIASHPEFLRQGTAVKDFLYPDRIVVGAAEPADAAKILKLYERVDAPKIVCSRPSAELAKYVANASLAIRVSFINEVAAICDSVGADITTVSSIVGMDHRIGPNYLKAGLGWGGSCLPKDVMALTNMADSNGHAPHILRAAATVNARQPLEAVEAIVRAGELAPGARVGILGIAFKPDTDDTRSSPALQIIGQLLGAGMEVSAHDPAAMKHLTRIYPQVKHCGDAYEVGEGAEALILATEWSEYLTLDWQRMRSIMSGKVLFDGRSALDASHLRSLGFTFLAPGRRGVVNEGLAV